MYLIIQFFKLKCVVLRTKAHSVLKCVVLRTKAHSVLKCVVLRTKAHSLLRNESSLFHKELATLWLGFCRSRQKLFVITDLQNTFFYNECKIRKCV